MRPRGTRAECRPPRRGRSRDPSGRRCRSSDRSRHRPRRRRPVRWPTRWWRPRSRSCRTCT
ncbi:hypothetical protein DEI92_06990 [Curtobacterium sp. MCBD17_034]|nr:hypothetical protein DEI92_06990 [Curtobacterium sp. MCBD17_034]PZM35103.1 hypothetical protein DEI90_04975 [Curtobacterium sp. MCBD17_031]